MGRHSAAPATRPERRCPCRRVAGRERLTGRELHSVVTAPPRRTIEDAFEPAARLGEIALASQRPPCQRCAQAGERHVAPPERLHGERAAADANEDAQDGRSLPGPIPTAPLPDTHGLPVRRQIQFIAHGVRVMQFQGTTRNGRLTGFFTPNVTPANSRAGRRPQLGNQYIADIPESPRFLASWSMTMHGVSKLSRGTSIAELMGAPPEQFRKNEAHEAGL